jgi:hypothetical protein
VKWLSGVDLHQQVYIALGTGLAACHRSEQAQASDAQRPQFGGILAQRRDRPLALGDAGGVCRSRLGGHHRPVLQRLVGKRRAEPRRRWPRGVTIR